MNGLVFRTANQTGDCGAREVVAIKFREGSEAALVICDEDTYCTFPKSKFPLCKGQNMIPRPRDYNGEDLEFPHGLRSCVHLVGFFMTPECAAQCDKEDAQ